MHQSSISWVNFPSVGAKISIGRKSRVHKPIIVVGIMENGGQFR